jgi:hypothetical protein
MKGKRIWKIHKSKQPPSRRLLQLYEYICQRADFADRFHMEDGDIEKIMGMLSRTKQSIVLSFSELKKLEIIELEYKKSIYKRKLYPEMDRNKEFIYYAQMRHKYNISKDELQELLNKQNYSCAICSRSQDDLEYRLYLDHCHNTNQNRGLLCRECNSGIGHFKDNPLFLFKAIRYLQLYNNITS